MRKHEIDELACLRDGDAGIPGQVNQRHDVQEGYKALTLINRVSSGIQ